MTRPSPWGGAAVAAALVGAGGWAAGRADLRVTSDRAAPEVVVSTPWTGRSPEQVEAVITAPIARRLLGTAGVTSVRGRSSLGRSTVITTFADGVDGSWARERVAEAIGRDRSAEATPTLGPDARLSDGAFRYVVVDDTGAHDLQQLRSLQDLHLRPVLASIEGVAEVSSIGGFVRQYQVEVDPLRLVAYELGVDDVVDAVRRSTDDVGGRMVELGSTAYMVRGRGTVRSVDDLRQVVLPGPNRQPVALGEVADVKVGAEPRRGFAELDGRGEVVAGAVRVRAGADPRAVVARVRDRLAALAPTLPPGVRLIPVDDPTARLDALLRGWWGVLAAQLAASGVAAAVSRAPALRVVAGPAAALGALGVWTAAGRTVDAATLTGLAAAAGWVGALAAGGAPARAFAAVAVALAPALWVGGDAVRTELVRASIAVLALGAAVAAALGPAAPSVAPLPSRSRLAGITAALGVAGALTVARLPSAPAPPVDDPSALTRVSTTFPGVSASEAARVLQAQDQVLRALPGVRSVFGTAGRSTSALDDAPVWRSEIVVGLEPLGRAARAALVAAIDAELQVPGTRGRWAGTEPLALRVYAPERADALAEVVRAVPGAASVSVDPTRDGVTLDYDLDRVRAARLGLGLDVVQRLLDTAIGGRPVARALDGRERVDIVVQYLRAFRDDPRSLGQVLVPLGARRTGGMAAADHDAPDRGLVQRPVEAPAQVPISALATVRFGSGPHVICSEDGAPYVDLAVEVDGDRYAFVDRAASALAATGARTRWIGLGPPPLHGGWGWAGLAVAGLAAVASLGAPGRGAWQWAPAAAAGAGLASGALGRPLDPGSVVGGFAAIGLAVAAGMGARWRGVVGALVVGGLPLWLGLGGPAAELGRSVAVPVLGGLVTASVARRLARR